MRRFCQILALCVAVLCRRLGGASARSRRHERRRDQGAAAAAGRWWLLSRRDRRASKPGAASRDQGLSVPGSRAAHRDRDARRSDQTHRRGPRLPHRGDGLGRQDRAGLVAAGRAPAAHLARADRAGQRRQDLCGGHVSGWALDRRGRVGCPGAAQHQNFVYIFEASTGALVARIGPFGNVLNNLTFSPDGRWLAANSPPASASK